MTGVSNFERWAEGPVLADLDNGILRITLNRPERKNAMTLEAWSSLLDLLRQAELDGDVRAVVLTGAGDTFCAGADISGTPQGHPLNRVAIISKTASAMFEFSRPIIAHVAGAAVGAGWNLALLCDFVVATPDARFSQIFVSRGLSVDFGGSWLLPRMVGLQQAKRLAMLGEFVDGNEAHQLGLVTWVKGRDVIDEFVTDLATRLAAGPPIALAQNKALLNQGATASFNDALSNETRAQAVNHGTEDSALAREAFSNGEQPEFTGLWRW